MKATRIILISAILGLLLGGFMAYAAFQHNPMEEFCTYLNDPSHGDQCTPNYASLSLVFLSWFVAGTVCITAAFFTVKGITYLFRDKK